jgi:hypothetical protein
MSSNGVAADDLEDSTRDVEQKLGFEIITSINHNHLTNSFGESHVDKEVGDLFRNRRWANRTEKREGEEREH